MHMVSIVFEKKDVGLNNTLIIEIAKRLYNIFGDRLIAVNTIDAFDGSNVRIVIKGKNFDDTRKVMEVIEEIEDAFDAHGKILPEIIGVENVEEISEKNRSVSP